MVIHWGTSRLILDNEEFRKGFEDGLEFYRALVGGGVEGIPASELLNWYTYMGTDGAYHLDSELVENPALLFGMLIGCVSGPLSE